jgi:hypothetical protein
MRLHVNHSFSAFEIVLLHCDDDECQATRRDQPRRPPADYPPSYARSHAKELGCL